MSKSQLAAFTIVQNEDRFLDIWIDYYSKHIDKKDLYILNHGSSTPSSLESIERARASGVNIVPVHRFHSFDHEWLRSTVCQFQSFLLHSYSAVIFAEADELIIPKLDAYKDGLRSYVLDKIGSKPDVIRCKGYSIEHLPSEELPIDFTKPLMAQRTYWKGTTIYDKPVVASRPCTWILGFHNLAHTDLPVDNNLLLIHLHRLDYDYCKAAHREKAARAWNPYDINNSWGLQNSLHEGKAFDDWFFEGSVSGLGNQLRGGPRERIPHYMKDAF